MHVRSAMNKTLGLILSILFLFEIFLFGIPLTTQASVPLPKAGQGIAFYLPQYSTVVYVYNVSLTSYNDIKSLDGLFSSYFNVLMTIQYNGQTYNLQLPISNFASDVYFAVNSTVGNVYYIIFAATVIGPSSTVGVKIPASLILQQLNLTNLLLVDYNDNQVTYVQSAGIVSEVSSQTLQGILTNPLSSKPNYFYDYVSGQVTTAFTVANGKYSISTAPTNQILVFAPFIFVPPYFAITPEATGYFNPLQLSGALGPALQSAATTKPYIWGRALINTSIVDPFVMNGIDNITFQLNYSVPGLLQINLAQLAQVASISNFPSKFTYLSYKFANGYYSFLGFITDGDNLTITINGVRVPAPVSGYLNLINPDPLYNVSLITIEPNIKANGTVVEYFSNLTVYYYNTSNQLTYAQVYHLPSQPHNYTLPVYGYYAPPGSIITITGVFNGTTYTVNIVVGSTPTLTSYVATASFTATAYEGIEANVSGYYTTSPIMSTPPSEISIAGKTQFQDNATLTSTSATAYVTVLTNATLPFKNVKLPGISFDGVIVTPEYPIINGTTAMQYMSTAQYLRTNGEYEVQISGSEIPMLSSIFNGLPNLMAVNISGPFANVLLSPSVPAVETGTGPLALDFVTVPQYAYLTLVNFGIWSNATSVITRAYSTTGGNTTLNKGYFYGVIIPPTIMTSKITPQSFVCYNAPTVTLYDPDAILVPGNPSGSFTYTVAKLNYTNMKVDGAVVFYGSKVYSYSSGIFGNKITPLTVTPVGTFTYKLLPTGVSQMNAWQLTLNGNTITPLPNGAVPYQLIYYADNNPTVNMFFEQGVMSSMPAYALPAYLAGLNVSYGNNELSPQMQVGYLEITPNGADYIMTNYITFKVLSAQAPVLTQYSMNTFITITPNGSFVGATDKYVHVSTDYAVFHSFASSMQYKVQTQITVPNITATLYFASNVTPLYSSTANLYFNETYYGTDLPDYLAIGTGGTLTWNAPNFQEFGVYATPLYLSKMIYVNVTLPSGAKEVVLLTTKNISTLFVSLDAQQLQYCNGTYQFEISIPGLVKILNLNVQQLNGSTLTVTVYDFVTHETLTASTKLLALSELTPVAIQPGKVFYFLTFKASNVILTASVPWFIAYNMYVEPQLNFTDFQYAHLNPTSVLHLSVNNITVSHNGFVATVYYNSTSGMTVVKNVYGVTTMYKGFLLPTLPETAANSGVFTGSLPFTIIPNTTVMTLQQNNVTLYTNGTLAFVLANGTKVPLGPAALFVLPKVAYLGKQIGYDANVSVTVSDPVASTTLETYLTSANITPIRLAPIPTIPPMANAPLANYYYTKPVVITPTSPVINIFATSVIPYPFEFYIIAIARPGYNVTTGTIVYYSYQAVVAKPALGIAAQPYIEVAVQMSGIIALPAGQYTVTMFAVPFAQGPTISLYPASLIFTNVTIKS